VGKKFAKKTWRITELTPLLIVHPGWQKQEKFMAGYKRIAKTGIGTQKYIVALWLRGHAAMWLCS